jgi:hypothetical protein
LSGALDPTATAVSIALEGDVGYSVLTAGLPDVASPDDPSVDAALSFSPALLPGSHRVFVRGVDGERRFGPPATVPLLARTASLSAHLLISLRWDTESDLDLHVVDPAGEEVWARSPNSYAPVPGEPPDPAGPANGGMLDLDSNAACIIDGRRNENVVWRVEPPPGRYLVRVDAASLCGQSAARWEVAAMLDGAVLGHAVGEATAADTRGPHDRGAGVLALSLDVP